MVTDANSRWRRLRQILGLCGAGILLSSSLLLAQPVSVSAEVRPYNTARLVSTDIGVPVDTLTTDGTVLAWLDTHGALYSRTIADGRETRLLDGDQRRSQLVLTAGTLLWLENTQQGTAVRGLRLSGGTPFTIAAGAGNRTNLTGNGTTLAWREGRAAAAQIISYDLATQRQQSLTTTPGVRGAIAINENTAIWEEFREGRWLLVFYNRQTGQETVLSNGTDELLAPALNGDLVAYLRRASGQTATMLILRDLRNGQEQKISEGHLHLRPQMAGEILVWEDWRDGFPTVYAFDRASGKTFPLVRAEDARTPAIGGTVVTWLGRGQFSAQITAIRLVKTLPSDPQDPPTVSDPDVRYFAETKHSTTGAFRQFWALQGGLATFGYPLTEAFEETAPDGTKRQVQYFERAKLEANPHDPKQVMLARLGAELTTGQTFSTVTPFETTADRAYFTQTGHSVNGWFLRYWQAQGGVNLFGYPISEEFVENGRLVQYFERARFELIPGNSKPDQGVELGQIGREALIKLGWLSPAAPQP